MPNYQQLLEAIQNLPANAGLGEKKNVAKSVAKELDVDEVALKDYQVHFKAHAVSTIGYKIAPLVNENVVNKDLAVFKDFLEKQVQANIAMDVEDGGRRKKRRTKKTKKTRRYTRRR